MEKLIDKSAILIEALPYIQSFHGKLIVVKLGGSVMADRALIESALLDIVFMKAVGMEVVVVHGGGKAITSKLEELQIKTEFINGLRYTCDKTIRVVDDVLHNKVNKELVDSIISGGGLAGALSGKKIFTAEKMYTCDIKTGEQVDIGAVGDIIKVDTSPIISILGHKKIPVITPLALNKNGDALNVNADIAACKIAEVLQARKLVFISDVPGILEDKNDENSIIHKIKSGELDVRQVNVSGRKVSL